MEEQSDLYENGKICPFKKGNISDSYGNYYYTIYRNGNPFYSLIFMDNAIRINQNQIDWYSNTIKAITLSNNGDLLPSWTFFINPY